MHQTSLVFLAIFCSISFSAAAQTNKSVMRKDDAHQAAAPQESCPSVKYSDKFEVAFVRKGACGSLKNVEFVIPYNGSCSGSEQAVDMDKYTSTNTGKKCGTLPVYSYTRKK